MGIIFLDIDGVLNDTDHFINNDCKTDGIVSHLAKEYMENLNEIVEFSNWKVVVISSWVNICTRDEIEGMFKERGFKYNLSVLKISPKPRAETVCNYIKQNSITDYLIIDDEYREKYIEQGILENHILTTSFYTTGLDKENMKKGIELIRNIYENKDLLEVE